VFAERVIAWQRVHGRHDLPWQADRDPYRIWLSEVMLQQTQVSAVLPYFQRFIARFPDVASLARAELDRVLEVWSGLGYYSRARNLHACARQIVSDHGGCFPRSADALARLPGIGRSTAAAIAAFAFGERAAILDGNVRRVLCRAFGVEGFPGQSAVERRLWEIAQRELPARDIEAYTQGLMDLGATLCTRARAQCERCPVAGSCVALREQRVAVLPTPRPRKVTPARETAVLAVCEGKRVLIERRPPTGIWGGLWSLPELPVVTARDDQALVAYLRAMGLEPLSTRPLPVFVHAFTHFRLSVHPYRVEVGATVRSPGSGGARWLSPDEIDGAALPTPIRSLLLSLVRD
jgi:A/G-specific adenine glycosylase